MFFGCHGRWTKTTTVLYDVCSIAKKRGVSVQIDFTIFRFVPFGVEQEVLCIEQFLNLLRMKLGAIRDGEGI
jgi:hypothetical protein